MDLFSNKDFVHVFHPSLKSLKSSSENGCHPCTLFYATLIAMEKSMGRYEESPVSFTRCVDISKGPGLTISCKRYFGLVNCVAETGFTQGMRRRYRLLE